jgi:hypothetical protein
VLNFFTGQPSAIFQAIEGQIDTSRSTALGQLGALLANIGPFWSVASGTFGFQRLTALLDARSGVVFRFVHPLDPPADRDGRLRLARPQPLPPAARHQRADREGRRPARLTGSDFPAAHASQLVITWADTTSGHVTQSDISWGPFVPGGVASPPRLDIKPRSFDDVQNFFVATGLSPNTQYSFSVRDEDALTETSFSPPLFLLTQPTDLKQASVG